MILEKFDEVWRKSLHLPTANAKRRSFYPYFSFVHYTDMNAVPGALSL